MILKNIELSLHSAKHSIYGTGSVSDRIQEARPL